MLAYKKNFYGIRFVLTSLFEYSRLAEVSLSITTKKIRRIVMLSD